MGASICHAVWDGGRRDGLCAVPFGYLYTREALRGEDFRLARRFSHADGVKDAGETADIRSDILAERCVALDDHPRRAAARAAIDLKRRNIYPVIGQQPRHVRDAAGLILIIDYQRRLLGGEAQRHTV